MKLFTLIFFTCISFGIKAQQKFTAYGFSKNCIAAQEMFKIALQYNGNEKLILFLQKADVRAELAKTALDSLPKTVLNKITVDEQTKLREGLNFIIQKSTAIIFDDEQMMKLVVWIRMMDMLMEKTIPKLLKQ